MTQAEVQSGPAFGCTVIGLDHVYLGDDRVGAAFARAYADALALTATER